MCYKEELVDWITTKTAP